MRRPLVVICAGTVLGTVFRYLTAEKYGEAAAFFFFPAAFLLFLFAVVLHYFLRKKTPASCKLFVFLQRGVPKTVFLFLAALAAASFLMGKAQEDISYLAQIAECGEQIAELRGIVLKAERKKQGSEYALTVQTEDADKTLVIVKAGCFDGYAFVGCPIVLREIRPELPAARRNPKCFDYRLYLRSIGIKTIIRAETAQLSVNSKPHGFYGTYLHYLSTLKSSFAAQLAEVKETDTVAFLEGMLFGETALMEEDFYEEFQRNGTAHVLAVSGLHVGALYGFLMRSLHGHRKISVMLLVAALLFVYAAVSSFSPSVMRAVSMIFLHMAARVFHRRYDMLSAACFCMIGGIACNPFIIFHTGFQLSYAAVFSIAVVGEEMERILGRTPALLFSVQLGMIPASAYLFNYFSAGAFFANIPVLFLAGLAVPFGILAFFLHCCGSTLLFSWMAEASLKLCDLIAQLNHFFYWDGFLTFDVTSPSIGLMVLYYGIVFGIFSETGRYLLQKRYLKELAAAAVLLLLLAAVWHSFTDDGFRRANLVFVDVGQGDCLHIKGNGGKHYLIDGGGSAFYDVGKNILKPYLLKNGVREIEIAFVSHLHKDHYDGIASLCREGMVRFLCLSESSRLLENEILEETGLLPSQLIYVKRGDRIFFEQEQVRMGNYRQKATETENEKRRSAEKRKEDGIVILSPEGQHEREYLRLLAEDDENQTSLIMKVELNGISVLMNGDISAEGERALLRDANCGKLNGLYRAETGNNVSADIAEGQSALTCTVLKAAHHGSKYSSCDEFIETVSPSAVIFQVGKNHYGHPDKSVIEKYRQKGIMIYRNDTDGAVGLICEKEKKDRRCGKRKAENGAALLFRVVTVRKDR